MSKPLNAIKAKVQALRAYSLSSDRASIKLNQNENPWNLPPEIGSEILRRVNERPWSRYPDFHARALHERLAEFAGWKADGIIAGNGSNELIQALLMVTVGSGTRVLISEPTFALYRQITTVLGGEVIRVPLSSKLTYDGEALRRAIESASPQVTIICSPNNPTGCVIDPKDLESLLEATRGLIVIDEAYHEFSGESVVPLLRQHPNLIVLRTFSKAMAMAGLRVGYLLTAPELAQEIAKAVLPYNLNVISQTAAQVAVEMYESTLKPLVNLICAERDRVYERLKEIKGLEPVPSRGNFMLVRSAMSPRLVFDELLRRDILIRDVSAYPMLGNYFRISVGTPEENDQLLASLREIFGSVDTPL
ncbi:MAG: histidinol-phosphate transaminase [Acidobacteria bacterium]|nr:MAG: histidinol-phosphate transaminase [Acidobacteriota bacterium]